MRTKKRRRGDKDELCVSPHGGGGGGGAPKWCLKMFLVQRDNERTMARPVLQSGISSYREHLALQAHRESEKLLSRVYVGTSHLCLVGLSYLLRAFCT